MNKGLFQRWLEIEKATGRTVEAILADLNTACGTKYRYTWPNVMAARQYSLERCPTEVRRYMMAKVLPLEIEALGLKLPEGKIFVLINNLT